MSAFRSTGFFLSANPCWNAVFFPGSLRQAEVFQDPAAHFPAANGGAAVGGKNIAGPEAPVQHRGDGGLNAVGLGGHIEGEAKHHGGGQNGADGVGKVPARDVRGGAVDGLVEPPCSVSQGGGGKETAFSLSTRFLYVTRIIARLPPLSSGQNQMSFPGLFPGPGRCFRGFAAFQECVKLGQHRTIRQEPVARDFSSAENLENRGILGVFPVFQTVRMREKTRHPAADAIVRCCLRIWRAVRTKRLLRRPLLYRNARVAL